MLQQTTLCFDSSGEVSNQWQVSSGLSLSNVLWWQGSLWPLLESLKWKGNSEIFQLMCVWIRPRGHQSSSAWPLLPSLSVWIAPCVFTAHFPQPNVCPLWTLWALSSNLQGQDRNFLFTKRGKTQPSQQWCKSLPHHIVHPPLPLTFSTSSFCHPFIPAWARADGETPPQREDLSQGANPAFVYQRSDYPVGCYLSPGDGCGVSGMTAPAPVGDVWSGMERQGLAEVLGSYQTECDLNSWWIPWGKYKTSPEVETKLCCSYCYFCALRKVSAEV